MFRRRFKGTTVFLDVDGVIASMGRNSSTLQHLPWDGWNASVNYEPVVVDRLKSLIAIHELRVEWLTSWQDEANPCFSRIGLGPYKTHFDLEHLEVWWKSLVVENYLVKNPHARAVWLDDEIDKYFNPQYETVTWQLSTYAPRLLALNPSGLDGLTMANLDTVETFLSLS